MIRSGVLAISWLCTALTPLCAGAAVFSYHLDGQVSRIVDTTQNESLETTLTPYAVKKGAPVSIDWTVDSGIGTHSPPGNNGETYFGVVTSFTIQVGSWTAIGGDPTTGFSVNKVALHDESPPTGLDEMDVFRSGSDTGSALAGSDPNGVQLVLLLTTVGGDASTSLTLGDQTPSLYHGLSGAVVGKDGEIDFSGVVTSPPVDTSVKCRTSQLIAAGALCKATLSCLAGYAKAPLKDPGKVKLDKCRAKADAKFVTAWDRATATAASKGLTCRTAESGVTAVGHVDGAVDDVLALADTIDPPQPALVSAWLAAAGTMCSAAAKAESKNVTRPDPAKLDQLRASARSKLTAAAQKGLAQAEKKGVVFDPEPDVAAFVASVDALIDEIVSEVNGP